MTRQPVHVAVVGGGISGLAAALALRRHGEVLRRQGGPVVRVTVYESAPRLGGKLAVSDVAGLPVDEGAEAVLARRPEGVALIREAGLGADLVPARTGEVGVWVRGRVRRLPARQVMGVPADLGALARSGILSPQGLLRAAADRVLPRRPAGDADEGADTSVGAYVSARLGREVVDRLVDPLLGGVYAGRADDLSFHATMPQLAAAAAGPGSLVAAAREVLAAAPRAGPTFVGLAGGLGRLPEAVARAAAAHVRTSTPVRDLRRTAAGWQLTMGPASAPEQVAADAVVLATPAHPTARLLGGVLSPSVVDDLAGLQYASVATVTLAFDRRDAETAAHLSAGSGFLVPAVEKRLVKAVTFLSSKWAWLTEAAPGTLVVRCSVGRHGGEADLQADDAELVRAVLADLQGMIGLPADPVDTRVRRWGGALPQYAVGHGQRVARVLGAVAAADGLAVCGAAYSGLGVPACVASAEKAASQVVAALGAAPSERAGRRAGSDNGRHGSDEQRAGRPVPGDETEGS